MNGPVHTLLKPPSLPEKSCFLFASGPDSQPACAGHADYLKVVLARAFSAIPSFRVL